MRESLIERHLVNKVKKMGGKAYKWSSPANRGVTDRIVFLKGEIWFVELKAPQGRLSPHQVIFKDWLTDYTTNYMILASKEAVDEWLRRFE